MFKRTLTHEFFTSASITSLKFEERLFFQATWLEADRDGRFKWNPATLKNRWFPADDLNVEEMGDALVKNDLIKRYQVGGREYAYIPNFQEYQYINNKERDSVLPPPDPPKKKRLEQNRIEESRYTRETRVRTRISRVKDIPSFLSEQLWEDYLHFRVEKKEPMTERAEEMAIKRLEKFQAKGHDITQIIENSIISNWSGLFEPKGGPAKKEDEPKLTPEQAAEISWEKRHGKQE